MTVRGGRARVLVHSTRAALPSLSRCHVVEFESVVAAHDDVDVVLAGNGSRRVPDFAWRGAQKLGLELRRASKPTPGRVEGRYPLFVAFGQDTKDLLYLEALDGWRERCDRKVAFLTDLWHKDLAFPKLLRRTLDAFDDVFLLTAGSIEGLRAIIGKPVHFLAPGVDALSFTPEPRWPERVVDVYYMGRRSPVAHAAFTRWAARTGRFYLHDTHGAGPVLDALEHRAVLRHWIQRTKYFVVNKGLVDRAAREKIQDDVPSRFAEGTAGGAVLIGDPPRTPRLGELFGWEDAIFELPFDSADGPDLVEALEREPERMEAVRRRNAAEALRRHDWIHRWLRILATVGLEPSAAARERVERLDASAAAIEQHRAPPSRPNDRVGRAA